MSSCAMGEDESRRRRHRKWCNLWPRWRRHMCIGGAVSGLSGAAAAAAAAGWRSFRAYEGHGGGSELGGAAVAAVHDGAFGVVRRGAVDDR
jgi:hypothetical protein